MNHIPETIIQVQASHLDEKTLQAMDKYVKSLSEKELKSYKIASTHLGMTFSLEKSRGFLNFIKSEAAAAASAK
jgi:hypothetical protein